MAYQSEHSGEQIDSAINQINEILNIFYPIGTIYTSTNSTSPATLFGGIWTPIKDTFLLTAGDIYTAGSIGGASSVNYTPKGTNTGTAITAAQMPKHRHTTRLWNNAGTKGNAKTTSNYGADVVDCSYGLGGATWGSWKNSSFTCAQDGYGDQNGITDIAGNGAAHTHTFNGTASVISTMPPYKVVYAWERTG